MTRPAPKAREIPSLLRHGPSARGQRNHRLNWPRERPPRSGLLVCSGSAGLSVFLHRSRGDLGPHPGGVQQPVEVVDFVVDEAGEAAVAHGGHGRASQSGRLDGDRNCHGDIDLPQPHQLRLPGPGRRPRLNPHYWAYDHDNLVQLVTEAGVPPQRCPPRSRAAWRGASLGT